MNSNEILEKTNCEHPQNLKYFIPLGYPNSSIPYDDGSEETRSPSYEDILDLEYHEDNIFQDHGEFIRECEKKTQKDHEEFDSTMISSSQSPNFTGYNVTQNNDDDFCFSNGSPEYTPITEHSISYKETGLCPIFKTDDKLVLVDQYGTNITLDDHILKCVFSDNSKKKRKATKDPELIPQKKKTKMTQ